MAFVLKTQWCSAVDSENCEFEPKQRAPLNEGVKYFGLGARCRARVQSRPFADVRATSGLPRETDIIRLAPLVRSVPEAEVGSRKQSSGHLLLLLMKLAMVSTASASIPK